MKQIVIVLLALFLVFAVQPAATQDATTPAPSEATPAAEEVNVPAPAAVQPATVSNGTVTELVVTGAGFVDGAAVILDGYGALKSTFVSPQMLRAELPAGVPAGVYTLRIVNPDATSAALPDALTITEPAITPTATGTTEPEPTATPQPTAFVRPVIVVSSYGASSAEITPGTELDFEMTLSNAGQASATNVIATFTSGDFMPRATGGVQSVGTLHPGQASRFWQPLSASRDLAGSATGVLEVQVSYTDVNGTGYSESFSLTFPVVRVATGVAAPTATPTPTTTPTTGPQLRPQLLVAGYETDVDSLEPGVRFDLSLNVRNQGSADARSITLIVGGGSASGGSPGGTPQPGGGLSGAGGEFGTFAPVGSSNVRFLGDLARGDNLDTSVQLIVNGTAKPGAYPVVVSFVYNDNSGGSYVDEQIVTLLVFSPPAVEVNFYMEPMPLTVGQPGPLPLQLTNMGKATTLFGSMTVQADGAQLSNNNIFIGSLEPGGTFPLDAIAIPEMPGTLALEVRVAYTDDFNQQQVISQTLTVEVMEMPEMPPEGGEPGIGGEMPPEMPPAAEESWRTKLWRFFLGMVGLSSGPVTPDGDSGMMPVDPGLMPSEGNSVGPRPGFRG
jgi:hypothetical protein